MVENTRIKPPQTGDEKTLLVAFLNYQRQTIIYKLAGLSEADAKRPVPPSTITLLGIAKHLAYGERWWFQQLFARHEVSFPWSASDKDPEWQIAPDETVAGIIELYNTEIAITNQIIAEHNLDDTGVLGEQEFSLRWLLIHLIEETARHAGHADLIREAIDGVTGE